MRQTPFSLQKRECLSLVQKNRVYNHVLLIKKLALVGGATIYIYIYIYMSGVPGPTLPSPNGMGGSVQPHLLYQLLHHLLYHLLPHLLCHLLPHLVYNLLPHLLTHVAPRRSVRNVLLETLKQIRIYQNGSQHAGCQTYSAVAY